ncbi:MAG: FKBP-type peptidyl-prolyl cis-trans isomerase [Prevotellaceae bacterium]|jgi:FKBP-type peptidyl-prolyl cis-trans isomerase|nr:FKBP-type peptidyl-prolyl cis-trans isomerase [Prevotellaceae bacterium]
MKKSVIILVLSSLVACTSEVERLAVSNQEQAINNYISAQMAADTSVRMVANNGSYRLIRMPGSAPEAAAGDSVRFYYIAYVFSNGKGMVFDTNRDTLGFKADTLGLKTDGGIGVVGAGHYIPGLDNGLTGMKTGEKAELIFPAAQGFGNVTVGLVPPLSALLFEIEMIQINK